MRSDKADVVVVGGGMAGLCAAVTAAETGADVLLIEKGRRLGGSMLLSGGLIWTAATREKLAGAVPDGNRVLQEAVVDGLRDGQEWLAGHGVPLRPEVNFQHYGRGRVAQPPEIVAALSEQLRRRSVRVRLGLGMQELVCADGRVVGLRAFGEEDPCEVVARSVVLATGGFQGNPELMERYVSPHAASMYLRSNPWSTGDGLIAATAAGAATTPYMSAFYGHALVAPPARFGPYEFLDMTQRYGNLAVALNLDGIRFTDETDGTGEEALNLAVGRQRDATAVYVLDAARMADPGASGNPPQVAVDRARGAGGPVLDAPTLEELAAGLAGWGVAPDAALATMQGFNAAMRDGAGSRLSPPRRRHARPLDAAPFTAVLVRAAITFTCGGLQADLDMRVLRRSATSSTMPLVTAASSETQMGAIPNLFAAGCDVGGISTRNYLGGLATALVTGRLAGAAAAENARVPQLAEDAA